MTPDDPYARYEAALIERMARGMRLPADRVKGIGTPRVLWTPTPSDRELLRLLAADPDVRNLAARLGRRALLVAAALIGVGGLIVATTNWSC